MITYGLLFGALALEIIAMVMLLQSNWTIIYLWKSPADSLHYNQSLQQRIIGVFIRHKLIFPKDHLPHGSPIQVLKRRWSESFSTYNIIYYCCHSRCSIKQVLYKRLGLDGFIDSIKYVNQEKFTVELRDFIFSELELKSGMADDMETAKEIISSRGDWVLRCESEDWSSLLHYFDHYNYDQSILIWHIATELCYYKEVKERSTNPNYENRDVARLLSGYMMYLHIMQPKMISATTSISQIQFRDTCATIKNIIQSETIQKEQTPTQRCEKACMKILDMEIEVFPPELTGYKNNSLLFAGCILAKSLMSLEKKSRGNKWLIISKVWLEMLCYGAVRSRADIQISQVNKGCDLITIVWLLMAHFGFSEQFESVDRDPDALLKLIVSK